MKTNYQKNLEKTINEIKSENKRPRLLLHSCCAPCSSYVLEYLNEIFDITIYFYNPNIFPEAEYISRFDEQKRFINEFIKEKNIDLINGDFDKDKFYEAVKGLESQPEGGERCLKCFELRLLKTAEYAKKNSFDFFTTTLTISPHKNAEAINTIGEDIGNQHGVKYLLSDFKKNEGYKRSIQLSNDYNLYRQDYCGCVYSKKL